MYAIRSYYALSQPVVLDVATGTGDLAIEAHKRLSCRVVGVDISVEMLKVAEEKIAKKGLGEWLSVQEGDSENLPFEDRITSYNVCYTKLLRS